MKHLNFYAGEGMEGQYSEAVLSHCSKKGSPAWLHVGAARIKVHYLLQQTHKASINILHTKESSPDQRSIAWFLGACSSILLSNVSISKITFEEIKNNHYK